MNKEQIIDEVYENYHNSYPDAEKTFQYEESIFETRRMTKDEFIDMIKSDIEYARRWGLTIEERELSREERIQIYVNQYMGGVGKPAGFEDAKLATRNIPTKLITVTYNNETIESYE